MQPVSALLAMTRTSLRLAMCICVQLFLSDRVEAQHLRLGVIGGTGLTSDYDTYYWPEQRVPLPDGPTIVYPGYFVRSAQRSPIGGPALAWEFNDRFSIETNAIYRRLRLQGIGPTITWQFPVLAKYRLPSPGGGVRPFVEIGPSFRTTGNLNTRPSHAGFAAGTGIDWHWRGFRFAPTLRYTRWTADHRLETVRSKQDQVETLFAVSRDAIGDRQPLGSRARLGMVGGLTLVRPLTNTSFGNTATPGNLFVSSRQSLRTWIVGPRLQVDLTGELAFLAEANYRHVRFRDTFSFDFIDQGGVHRQGTRSFNGKAAVLWQFPVLLRYRFGGGFARPFIDAGPSFRLPQDIGGNLSSLGLTGGAGMRFKRHGVGFESGLRFSHWGSTKYRNGEIAPNDVRRNQLDAIFAVSF